MNSQDLIGAEIDTPHVPLNMPKIVAQNYSDTLRLMARALDTLAADLEASAHGRTWPEMCAARIDVANDLMQLPMRIESIAYQLYPSLR